MALQPLGFNPVSDEELIERAAIFRQELSTRRSVRDFSTRAVPMRVIQNIIMTAASAPSGANQQPWKFVVVQDPTVKRRIRIAAEKEEKLFYDRRAPEGWIAEVAPLGTDWRKPFLEDAPYLIIVFKQIYGVKNDVRIKHYYVNESVGIAVGVLLTAIHQSGLVALTHTPNPMAFLAEILNRPAYEKAYLLIPVGYPKDGVVVPELTRKTFDEVTDVF